MMENLGGDVIVLGGELGWVEFGPFFSNFASHFAHHFEQTHIPHDHPSQLYQIHPSHPHLLVLLYPIPILLFPNIPNNNTITIPPKKTPTTSPIRNPTTTIPPQLHMSAQERELVVTGDEISCPFPNPIMYV